MAEQNRDLHPLRLNVPTTSGIIDLLSGTDMLSILEKLSVVGSQSAANGAFVVPKESVVDFLEDVFSRTVADLTFVVTHAHIYVLLSVGEMLLSTLSQKASLQSGRSTDNSFFVHVMSPVLQAQIYALRPRQHVDVVEPQAYRLKLTWGAKHIVALEDEF